MNKEQGVGGINYQALEFGYTPRTAPDTQRHAVAVVGAGPVGLSMALDLAQRGLTVVLIYDDHRLSTGSRAICFVKRTPDVWDRQIGRATACTPVHYSHLVCRYPVDKYNHTTCTFAHSSGPRHKKKRKS